VRAFAKTGIRGGLNWSRNVDRDREDSAAQGERVNINGSGRRPPQERPSEVNAAIIEFLYDLL